MYFTKLKSVPKLIPILNKLRKENKKIVFTNGCFDILHKGHIKYLKDAKKCGDILVIGLNSDTSVRALKGKNRPIYPQSERAEVLSALDCVDYIVLFDESTPYQIIKKVSPDILVKGGDYTLGTIVGRRFVHSKGGRVITIPLVKGKSTSDIIKKINTK
ncbi:D-glycero-beta-D-manno-heptose 1-phosphate adenylyltransferase [bacterium]